MKRLATTLFVLGACGGDSPSNPPADSGPGDDGDVDSAIDSPPAAFAITSPAFSEGMTISTVHTCDGANTSPQLDWVGAPPGTQSFGIVLTDISNNNLIHSVIYDIPANLTGLPADVEKVFAPSNVPGAHQTRTLGGAGNFGYRGPCPPPQDAAHIYQFALYAIDVATLPDLDMTSIQAEGKAAIEMHAIGTPVLLTGMYER